jgi:hypothetical protein
VPKVLSVIAIQLVQQRLDKVFSVVVRHRVPGAVVILEEVRTFAVDPNRSDLWSSPKE